MTQKERSDTLQKDVRELIIDECQTKKNKGKEKDDFATLERVASKIYGKAYIYANAKGKAEYRNKIKATVNNYKERWLLLFNVNIVPVRKPKDALHTIQGYFHVTEKGYNDYAYEEKMYQLHLEKVRTDAKVRYLTMQERAGVTMVRTKFKEINKSQVEINQLPN